MTPIRLTIADYRERAGFTQDELSAKSGVRRATISDYERGRVRRIDLDILEKIARALGVDAALLLVTEPRRGKR